MSTLRPPGRTASRLDGDPRDSYHPGMIARRDLPAGTNDAGRRLDRVLRKLLPNLKLSALHGMIRKGLVQVNGARARADQILLLGDSIGIPDFVFGQAGSFHAAGFREKSPASALPILLETEDLLFLNKPAGLLVHGGGETLESMAKAYLSGRLPPSLAFTPGPLHRLDRNTSGVVAFSKSIAGARRFSEALQSGEISKTYLAVHFGNEMHAEDWRDNLVRDGRTKKSLLAKDERPENGKAAATSVRPILQSGRYHAAAISLMTGRTHQIRSQAAARGIPLAGDAKYGAPASSRMPGAPGGYLLHAWSLDFASQGLSVEAPLPDYFLLSLKTIFSADEKEVYSLLRQSKS